jgi:hypothetical protein
MESSYQVKLDKLSDYVYLRIGEKHVTSIRFCIAPCFQGENHLTSLLEAFNEDRAYNHPFGDLGATYFTLIYTPENKTVTVNSNFVKADIPLTDELRHAFQKLSDTYQI